MPAPASVPVVTFLSDYGLHDDFVGICHGVIAKICPAARVIDLTHGIGRHDVRSGAVVLAEAMPFVPVGIHLAVVDPDVGARRRAVALQTADERLLVGPDNGLLTVAAEVAGGIVEAVDIAHSRFRLEPVSATFHGRDIFAPVAAALAAGTPLGEVGAPVDPQSLVTLDLPAAQAGPGGLIAHVRYVDRFGNLSLNATHEHLPELGLKLGRPATLALRDGTRHRAQFARTFADVGEGQLLLYEDAQRQLAVAISHGDAAATLGLTLDDEIRIQVQ